MLVGSVKMLLLCHVNYLVTKSACDWSTVGNEFSAQSKRSCKPASTQEFLYVARGDRKRGSLRRCQVHSATTSLAQRLLSTRSSLYVATGKTEQICYGYSFVTVMKLIIFWCLLTGLWKSSSDVRSWLETGPYKCRYDKCFKVIVCSMSPCCEESCAVPPA